MYQQTQTPATSTQKDTKDVILDGESRAALKSIMNTTGLDELASINLALVQFSKALMIETATKKPRDIASLKTMLSRNRRHHK
jgi:hypothetical protein